MFFRYVIWGLATACLTFVYALRLAFHTTILCQHSPTDNITKYHYLSNSTSRVLSYSAVSIGLLIGLIPLTTLYYWGTRKIFVLYGVIGVISSFLYPTADGYGFIPAFVCRLFQGLPGAMYLWAVNSVSTEWAPRNQMGICIALLTCLYQLSPILASVTSAEMCTSYGWEWTYYILAAITGVLFIAFWFLYTDNPHNNRFTSREEADMITEGKSKMSSESHLPFRAIMTDPQVYLAWFLYLSFFVGAYVFLQFGPIYINMVLNYKIRSTGWLMAIPHVISLVAKFAYGRILDRCLHFSQRARLILAYGSVELISAACLCTMLFTRSKAIALVVYVVFNSLHSLVVVVVMRQMQLIARQHAHLLANGNTFLVAILVLLTSLLQYFVQTNNQEQWMGVFLGVAILIVISVVLFSCCSTSAARPWTQLDPIPLQDKS